ncbi:MAG: hypothetical protein GTN49_10730 [candidate division Zixibacteria bacterium]|nr:hypothetical protein [candidate division Zixibacteria bacterium]
MEIDDDILERVLRTCRDVISIATGLRNGMAVDGFDDIDDRIDDAIISTDDLETVLYAGDDEPDIEAAIALVEQAEYEAGKAEAEMRRAERRIYGDELAEQFHMQDDLNRYNRGEDD